jgi:hypothetical protein
MLFIASTYNSHQSFMQSPSFYIAIRLLRIHRGFYAVTRYKSSLGQDVLGLSLSRRNEGLKVDSK